MGPFRFEGYVIVSADGMLADAHNVMPVSLKFEADQAFFSDRLDRADLIVHGRHSFEDQPNSPERKRIVLTRAVGDATRSDDDPKMTQWNPAHASLEAACSAAGVGSGTIAVIGGPAVFAMFMPRYDVFWLSQAHRVRVPGGRGVFPGVPERSPQQVMASNGLVAGEPRVLDERNDVTVTPWRRQTSEYAESFSRI